MDGDNTAVPGVLTCTPDLPVAYSEGGVEHLVVRHLDWHNSTALAYSELDTSEKIKLGIGLLAALKVKKGNCSQSPSYNHKIAVRVLI